MTKYLLLSKYGEIEGVEPMTNWAPEDITAHLDFLSAFNRELIDKGEFVDGQALTGPELAKKVSSDGVSAPVITDGPFPEIEGAARRLPDRRRRVGGAGLRDRGQRRPRRGRAASRSGSRSRSAR